MSILRTVAAFLAGAVGLVLAVPVLLGAVPLWLTAAAVRRLVRWLEPPVTPWEEIIEFDDELGWRPKPHLRVHAHNVNGDAFGFELDERGFRGPGRVEEADIVVVGDSYAFGYAADEDEFYGNLVEGLRVKGIGGPGYSMVQPYLWMRRLGPVLEDKLVVWFVYVGNDLDDTLRPQQIGHHSPYLRERRNGSGWELVTEHLSPEKPAFEYGRENYEMLVDICSDTPYSRRVFSAAEHLIREGRDLCRRVGAGLVVMTVPELAPLTHGHIRALLGRRGVPESYDPEKPRRRLREICGTLDVDHVGLSEHLEVSDYLRHDVHWTPEGNGKVADLLRRIHEDWRRAGRPAASPATGSGTTSPRERETATAATGTYGPGAPEPQGSAP